MRTITISDNESGQRLDKFLKKYMPEASGSFFYKMLRKKNITLNSKKADGSEKVMVGDSVTLFLAEETIDKFRGNQTDNGRRGMDTKPYEAAYLASKDKVSVVFENNHIIIFNKPVGMLSQKADEKEASLNEYLIGYLLLKKELTAEDLLTFKPSICNRLDRNTSGMVICGKSLQGLQKMSELLKQRTLHKYYHCIVLGGITKEQRLEGYLEKNETSNTVSITQKQTKDNKGDYIITTYKPLRHGEKVTLLEVELVTGKTHQIRAHLASIGYPILGDYKYGNRAVNEKLKKKYHLNSQLLHACRLEFPQLEEPFLDISKRKLEAEPPIIFEKVMAEEWN